MNAEITIKLKSGSTFTFPLALLGYGLLNIWGLEVDGNAALSQTGAGATAQFVSVSLSYAVTLIAFATLHHHFDTHLTKKAAVLGSGVVGCLGVVALALAGQAEAESYALITFGGMATGATRGYLALLWMSIYVKLQPRMLLVAFASSLALLSLGEALISVSEQFLIVSLVLLFCLPLLCALLASASLRQVKDTSNEAMNAPLDKTSWSFPYKPVIMLAAYTFVIDFVGGHQFVGELYSHRHGRKRPPRRVPLRFWSALREGLQYRDPLPALAPCRSRRAPPLSGFFGPWRVHALALLRRIRIRMLHHLQ